MAIDPSSDIVLEVAKAADPMRAAAAAQRLNTLAATGGADAADFAQTLAATASAAVAPGAANARARFAAAAADTAEGKAKKVEIGFEAVMLNSFVKEMLPKDAESVFGQGLAGDMWKSLLADQVSRQMAKSDVLGIAKRLFATHPLAASSALEQPRRADAAKSAAVAQMSGNSLALPIAADVPSGAVLFAKEKRS